jgi:uncharacterized OB-fold protein
MTKTCEKCGRGVRTDKPLCAACRRGDYRQSELLCAPTTSADWERLARSNSDALAAWVRGMRAPGGFWDPPPAWLGAVE